MVVCMFPTVQHTVGPREGVPYVLYEKGLNQGQDGSLGRGRTGARPNGTETHLTG